MHDVDIQRDGMLLTCKEYGSTGKGKKRDKEMMNDEKNKDHDAILTFPSVKALMTMPKAVNDLLIFLASSRV